MEPSVKLAIVAAGVFFLTKVPNVEPWLVDNAKDKIRLFSQLD